MWTQRTGGRQKSRCHARCIETRRVSGEEKVVFHRGCVLQHREEDVEYCEPGEGTVNVALSSPAFWVKGEVADSVKTRKIPLLKGTRGAYNSVARVGEVYKPLSNVQGNTETLPAEEDERLGDRVEGLFHVPGAAVKRALFFPGYLQRVKELKIRGICATLVGRYPCSAADKSEKPEGDEDRPEKRRSSGDIAVSDSNGGRGQHPAGFAQASLLEGPEQPWPRGVDQMHVALFPRASGVQESVYA